MADELKQQAISHLARALSRVSAEAMRKYIEEHAILLPFRIGVKPIALRARLAQCNAQDAARFRQVLRCYIGEFLYGNFEAKERAKSELLDAARCLLPDGVPQDEVARRLEVLVDRLTDSEIPAAEWAVKANGKSRY